VCFSFRCGPRFLKKHRDPLVYGILRTEFDALLLQQARAAGADVRENCRATAIEGIGEDRVRIETSSGRFEARFVVGADGANSVVRQSVNKRSDYHWNVALSCEVPLERLNAGVLDERTARIDWGTLPGYGWMFPKRGFVNIGVGGPAQGGRMLRGYLERFLATEKVLKNGVMADLPFRGHQLPTLRPGTALSRGNVLLAGDAAGLVDPMTGDGISFGLHGAGIASDTLLELLNGEHRDVGIYDRRVMEEIGAELFWSQRLGTLLVAFPRLVHKSVHHFDHFWRAFCQVMRGDESLLVFRKKLLPVAPLLRWLEPLAARRERRVVARNSAV
jgi:flavin-dependent dehydrogenase